MARKFGFDITESSIYKTEAQHLNFDPKRFNLRWKMPTEQQIKGLAEDIRTDPRGQKNPIAIWYVKEDGKDVPYVVEGFCRYLAIKQINNKEFDEGKPLTPIKFCVIPNKTALREIMASNVSENVSRFELTIVDKAYGMQQLVDKHGFTQEEVAKRYGVSQSTVSNYIRLLKFPEDVLDKIHEGNLNYTDALLLMKVAPDKASKIVSGPDPEANKSTPSSKVGNPRVPGDNSADEKKRIKDAIKNEKLSSGGSQRYARKVSDFADLISIKEAEAFEAVDEGKKPLVDPDIFRLVLNPVMMFFDGTLSADDLLLRINKNITLKKEKEK